MQTYRSSVISPSPVHRSGTVGGQSSVTKLTKLLLVGFLSSTTACFNGPSSSTASFAGSDGTIVTTVEDMAKLINDGSATGASIRGDMKISDYYGALLSQAGATSNLTIGNLEFRNLRDFFVENSNLINNLDKQYKNIRTYRQATGSSPTHALTVVELQSALKALHSILNRPKTSRSLNQFRSSSSRNSFSQEVALMLADGPKDMNGGCTDDEADDYRQRIAKPLCEGSNEGKEYLEKVGKIVGYVGTAATVTKVTAGVLTPAATAGAGIGGAAAATAGVVGAGVGLVGGAVGLVLLRAKMNAKYYCPQVVKAAPLQHCECSNDSSCQETLSGS